jgi:hypothetical protein
MCGTAEGRGRLVWGGCLPLPGSSTRPGTAGAFPVVETTEWKDGHEDDHDK